MPNITIIASDGTSFALTTAQVKAQTALKPNVQALIAGMISNLVVSS